MDGRIEIKDRIKQLLFMTGDRQADLERKTGLAKSSVSSYLSGQRIPRQDKISAIADAYHVNPAWIMGYDVPMKKLSSSQADKDFDLLDKWHKLTDSQQQLIEKMIDEFLNQ